MSGLDILLAIIITGAGIKGLLDGFLKQTFSLLSFLVAIAGVWLARGSFYLFLCEMIPHTTISPLLSAVILFVSVYILVRIPGRILCKLLSHTPFGVLDHVLGLLLGLAVSGSICAFFCYSYYTAAIQYGWPLPPTGSVLFYLLNTYWQAWGPSLNL